MKLAPDLNDTLRRDGPDAVRARMDGAWKYNGSARLIIPSGEFVANYTPPDYALDGILQKKRVYSLTGRTGDGKTAIKLDLTYRFAANVMLAGREVSRCRVLYLAGENPDDVRGRWIAMGDHLGFETKTIDVHFVPGIFKVSEMFAQLEDEVRAMGGVGAVMVDTSAAFFEGDAENDNVQAGDHGRMLRRLTYLPGGPVVIVGCHPAKHATNDNMLPRGGGALIAELDGNLTAIAREKVVEMSWAGKFRGPDFDPISFEIASVTSERLKDSRGKSVWTAIARPIGSARREEIEDEVRSNEDQVLLVLDQSPDYSMAQIAKSLGWLSEKVNERGQREPLKARVQRALGVLKGEKLADTTRGKWALTDKGKKTAKALREKAF
jgi:hypothetical protein